MKHQIHECVAFRLRRLSRIADSYLRKSLLEFKVTENQVNILFALSAFGKVEQGVVGKKMGLERSTISRGIRLLEKREYVLKTSDYQPKIELTKKGKEVVQKLMPIWEKFMNEMYEKIGQEGIEQIKKLEQKLL